jgi:hypothetical protein
MAPPSRPAQFERVLSKFLASVSQRVAAVDLQYVFEEVMHERPSAKADIEVRPSRRRAAFDGVSRARARRWPPRSAATSRPRSASSSPKRL